VGVLRALRPSLLGRYIVAETLPPTLLGLLLFTFILLLQQITVLTGVLISRGASLTKILKVFLYLLPSILSVTIPMAFLLGVLLAFGRLAADSEIVALRASGVSTAKLLKPVLALSALTGLTTFYIMAVALPAANQSYRELYYSIVVSKARTGVKPRVFVDDLLPGMVLYVSDVAPETGYWKNVFISDLRVPQEPQVILARTGRLVIDEGMKSAELHLQNGVRHFFSAVNPGERYVHQRFSVGDFPLPFEELFPTVPLSKGERELTLHELSERIQEGEAQGKSELDLARLHVEWHKKFAIPTACLVFGLLGLGLSLGSRKEARSAAFGLSIAVIFVYYVIIRLGEQAGDTCLLDPFWAMWGANVVLGTIAVVLLVLNHRGAAFDPLDPTNYLRWLPRIRRVAAPATRGVLTERSSRGPWLAFPGILDRHIARRFLGHLLLVLVAFWSIFTLAHFMDIFDDIQQNRVKGAVVFHFYTFYSPFIINLMAPVAMLVATLTTFGILARHNEITAMKASGISIYRATFPVVGLGVLASSLLFAMGEFLLPYTNRLAAKDFNVIKGRPARSSNYLERRWVMGSFGRLYNYDYLSETRPQGRTDPRVAGSSGFALYGVSIFDLDASKWDIKDRLYAARAAWNGASYDLERGWRWSFAPEGGQRDTFRRLEGVRTREIDPPNYFEREEPDSDALGFADLKSHIAALDSLGLDVSRLSVQLHRKVAFPSVTLVMTLIGIPFAFIVGRRGALYGIGISIVVAIVYWSCLGIFEALGNNARLPAVLAAWAPNLLFGVAGLYKMLTLET